MDFEDEIISMIPAPSGNAWIKTWSEDDGIIYYEQVIGFAYTRDKHGYKRLISLVLSGDGQPSEALGHEVVYSDTQPEIIEINKNEMEDKNNG